MSQINLEALDTFAPLLEQLGMKDFIGSLSRLLSEQQISNENLGSALVGLGIGLLTAEGYQPERLREMVESVIAVMPVPSPPATSLPPSN